MKKKKRKIEIVKMFTCLEHCVPVVIAMQIERKQCSCFCLYPKEMGR